jgi:hypothetical protein
VSLERLTWSSVQPYEHGYEQRTGTAVIALDPDHPANSAIVDLDRAPRDRDGLVRVETDVVLLAAPRPTTLLHVVANRGMVMALPYGGGETLSPDPTGRIESGDGWLLRRGVSVLWVGWQWDVSRRPGAVGIDAPDALDGDGRPLSGQARLGFQPVIDTPRRRLADEVLAYMGRFHPLPAADLDEPQAILTSRAWFNGPRTVVPRHQWRFADAEHLELDGGFSARTHYELTYTTSRCPVTGIGLAAVRDVVSHLRGTFSHVHALGVSQSGRWLRQFIYDTGNADEAGQAVFDGVHCHIAGGRRGEFNHRYAQPSTMNHLGFGHLPPFSPTDGLFERARRSGTVPKTVFTNTATEYWRGDASLVHPVPDGSEWRCYLYAGAHHSGQMPGYVESLPVQLPANLVNIALLTRAHFAALDEWVSEDREPPPSAVPRPDDGTGISREAALEALGERWWFDDVTLPAPEALLGMPELDLGPEADRGVGRFPAVAGPIRDCLVSAIDEDGNEVAGVRLPDVSVPLAVSVGWNPERPRPDVPVEVWNLLGGRVPFPADELRRRYGDRDGYLSLVRDAARRLAAQRHLLADDEEAAIRRAGEHWDTATKVDRTAV